MTLSSETVRLSYSGNGSTTEFPVTFVFWDNSDILAVLRASSGTETTWVLGTNYTLTGGNGDGGTLTAITAPASGTTLVITSNRAFTQTNSYPLGGDFPSTIVEQTEDKNVRLMQQVKRDVDRSIKFPLTDSTSLSTNVPSSSDRAGKYLVFTASGELTVSTGTGSDSTIRTDLATSSSTSLGDALVAVKRNETGATAMTVHSWIEAQWLNVKEFGATGDGATDDTAAFAAALAAITAGGTIFIPAGTYMVNVTVNKAVVFRGEGMRVSICKSFTAAGIVFLQIVNDSSGEWPIQAQFMDMKICGPSGTVTATGVQFGNTVYASNDEYAGRSMFVRVFFEDCNYGVRKLYGNIGNVFSACRWDNCNYHMHAYGDASPNMHAGCDVYRDMCHFNGALLAVFYYDSAVAGTGMMITDDCIAENNPGFIYFVKNFTSTDWAPGFTIGKLWNENNHTAASVTIDSVAYTPPKFARFENVQVVRISETRLTTFTLVNSTVLTEQCHYSEDFALTEDADSAFINNDFHVRAGVAALKDAGEIRTICGMEVDAGNTAFGVPIAHPHKLSFAYNSNIKSSVAFTHTVDFSGTATIATTDAADGVIFDVAQDLSYTSAQSEHIGSVATTSGKYYVAMLTIKKISGNAPTVRVINSGTALGTFGSISNTVWKTFAFMAKSVGTEANVACFCDPPSSGTTVLRFGGYQLLQFDTKQEALDFLNSGIFALLIASVRRSSFIVKSGTGSISSGSTTHAVTHGLGMTPVAANISVIFTEQGTNDYGRWWISSITSTQFTVNVSADPGASNLDFSWQAIV